MPKTDTRPSCEDCGETYNADKNGVPATSRPYTCDDPDCGGYVGPVFDDE